MSSTKWNEDVEHLPEKFQSGYYTIDKSFSSWYKDKEWYDELLKNSDDLEEIYINGGEPMIIKEHIYFLEKLCEMGKSKNIKLLYSINLTIISDKIIELWGKFMSVELNVSIDDLVVATSREIAAGRMKPDHSLRKLAEMGMAAPHLSREQLLAGAGEKSPQGAPSRPWWKFWAT